MKLLYLFTFILLIKTTYSQTADNTRGYNEKNIYYNALTQYLLYIKADRGQSIDTIYLEEGYLTDSLLLKSGQTKFIKLKYQQIPEHLKKHKGLTLYKLFPLQFRNGEFSVSFVPFGVSYSKRKRDTHYINPGSYRVVYKFQDNKFFFIRVEDHGI